MIFCKRPIKMSDIYQNHNSKWADSVQGACKSQQTNQLLMFCDMILKYEKYKLPADEMDDSAYSPSGSDGGSSDSYSTESNSSFNSSGSSDEMKSEIVGQDESWNLITCHCMKPFAGRPMIECSVCQNWVHMSCEKVRKNNVPEKFTCTPCRETKSNKRRSQRRRRRVDRGFALLR